MDIFGTYLKLQKTLQKCMKINVFQNQLLSCIKTILSCTKIAPRGVLLTTGAWPELGSEGVWELRV